MEDYIDLLVYVNNTANNIVKNGMVTLREESAEYFFNSNICRNGKMDSKNKFRRRKRRV